MTEQLSDREIKQAVADLRPGEIEDVSGVISATTNEALSTPGIC